MEDRHDLRKLLAEVAGDLSPEEETVLMDVFASAALDLPPLPPSPGLKARLMRSVEAPRHAFAERVAGLLGLGIARARAILDRADDLAGWEQSAPGMWLLHLEGGPALANAVVGLVRVEAGRRFPRHVHLGDERVLVLEGGLQDERGQIALAGDLLGMAGGTEHDFVALPGEDLLYLAVVEEGVDFSPAGGGRVLPRRSPDHG